MIYYQKIHLFSCGGFNCNTSVSNVFPYPNSKRGLTYLGLRRAIECSRELRDVRHRAVYTEPVWRVRVGPYARNLRHIGEYLIDRQHGGRQATYGSRGLDVLGPAPSEGDEEHLLAEEHVVRISRTKSPNRRIGVPRVVEAGEKELFLVIVLRLPCPVCLNEAAVPDVLARRPAL